jgi:hypothetical protein
MDYPWGVWQLIYSHRPDNAIDVVQGYTQLNIIDAETKIISKILI